MSGPFNGICYKCGARLVLPTRCANCGPVVEDDANAAVYANLQHGCWTVDGAIYAVMPLPPGLLGHHGGGWVKTGVTRSGRRYRVSQYSSEFAYHKQLACHVYWQALKWQRVYWPGSTMHVVWRFAGKQPDDDGAWGRLAAYRDAAQEAGIVADDLTVRQGTLEFIRVPRRYQCVEVSFFKRFEDEI